MTNTLKLKERRAAAGLTQKQLAERTGYGERYIKHLEKGTRNPSVEVMRKLAEALDCTLAELFNGAQVAAATAIAGAAAALRHGDLVTLPWSSLDPWKNQPRRSIDAEALAELAASIAAKGVLENLVVRPAGDRYEIIAGERRYRAVGLLIADGRASGEYDMPCLFIMADDLEATRLALVENLQRADVNPLEEAEGIARLVEAGDSTATIAQAIGKTQRYVQLRVGLVTRLTDAVKQRVRAGELSAQQARVIATAEPDRQSTILERLDSGWLKSEADLKKLATFDKPLTSWALFPLDRYKGEFLADPDEPEDRFADTDEAIRLQIEAIEEKAEKIRKKWAWVEIVWNGKGEYFRGYDYDKSDDREVAGFAIEVDELYSIHEYPGLVKKPKGAAPAKAAKPQPAPDGEVDPWATWPPCTKEHLWHAVRRKSAALQDATLAAGPRLAKALVILGLMGAHGIGPRIGREAIQKDEKATGAAVAEMLETLGVKTFAKATRASVAGDLELVDVEHWKDKAGRKTASAFRAVLDLDDADLDRLFCAVVARQVGTFGHDYEPHLGDNAFAVALAETVGLAGQEGPALELETADLAGLRRPVLERIAAALEVKTSVKDTAKAVVAKIAEVAARDAPQTNLARVGHYVAPTLRFGPEEVIGNIIKAEGAKPADPLAAALPAKCRRRA